MNNININNYEAYLLDYVEGNLSAEVRAELLLFIAQHPELDVDINGITEAVVEPENVHLENKSQYHKLDENLVRHFEMLSVLVLDQEANEKEKNQHKQLLRQYPLLQKHSDQFEKTFLAAEHFINYPFKESLYNIPDSATVFEHLAVADLEGFNDNQAKKQLEKLLQNSPLFKKEMFAFHHSVLKADKEIVFENKNQIKRAVITPSLWGRNWKTVVSGIAATLLIVISLSTIFNEKENKNLAMSIQDISTSQTISNKKVLNISTSAIEQEKEKELTNINTHNSSAQTIHSHIVSFPITKIEALTPISIKELPNDLYAGILADQINPVDMSIKFYPEDGILEKENSNNEILKLKNLALKQLNKVVGVPEEKEWTGNDIAQGIEQATNGSLKIKNDKEEGRLFYGFSLGNFSYERSKNK